MILRMKEYLFIYDVYVYAYVITLNQILRTWHTLK